MGPNDAPHQHQFVCPETVAHATETTPVYDATAWDHNLAPRWDVDELHATYLRQVADGHAAGDGIVR